MRPKKVIWLKGGTEEMRHTIRQAFEYRVDMRLLDVEEFPDVDARVLIDACAGYITCSRVGEEHVVRPVGEGEGFIARLINTVQDLNSRKRGPKSSKPHRMSQKQEYQHDHQDRTQPVAATPVCANRCIRSRRLAGRRSRV